METQHRHPGGHWSARNPVPTIQKFIETLDKDKKERDRKIDGDSKNKKQEHRKDKSRESTFDREERAARSSQRSRRVTDPTTGREIEIEDVGKDFIKSVKDPKVGMTP